MPCSGGPSAVGGPHLGLLMRLVTWNCCRGPFAKKAAFLAPLRPDVAVIQECARPEQVSDTCLWFGENPRQGMAVVSSNGFRLRALPQLADIPNYCFPVEVSGPESFVMLVVWSKGRQKFRYVMGVVKAVEAYRSLVEQAPTVLIGDLNSNAIWDGWHPKHLNHSALIGLLGSLGIESSYHWFFKENHGAETRPTCYLLWKEGRPYHIDYCFLPRSWLSRIRSVEVGTYEDWKAVSDHRPMVVDLADLDQHPPMA